MVTYISNIRGHLYIKYSWSPIYQIFRNGKLIIDVNHQTAVKLTPCNP